MFMRRINVYLRDRQYEELTAISQETEIKFSEHVRRAVDLYLNHLKAEERREKRLAQADENL